MLVFLIPYLLVYKEEVYTNIVLLNMEQMTIMTVIITGNNILFLSPTEFKIVNL